MAAVSCVRASDLTIAFLTIAVSVTVTDGLDVDPEDADRAARLQRQAAIIQRPHAAA